MTNYIGSGLGASFGYAQESPVGTYAPSTQFLQVLKSALAAKPRSTDRLGLGG